MGMIDQDHTTTLKTTSSNGVSVKKSKKKTKANPIEELVLAHPIINVLNKKLRSVKKKIEKIKTLQGALSEGKKLNEQQQEVILNKPSTEKLLLEFENLKQQIVDIMIQEEEEKLKEAEIVVQEVVEKEEEQVVQPTEMSDNESNTVDTTKDDGVDEVTEILRLLHVVTLHQAIGKHIPSPVDFFGKVLLGNTRPPAELSFEENLSESIEEAKKYLASSDKVVACDMTYAQLKASVDEILNPKPIQENNEKMVEQLGTPETPQFNFFTESQLETPDAIESETRPSQASLCHSPDARVILSTSADEVVDSSQELLSEPSPVDDKEPTSNSGGKDKVKQRSNRGGRTYCPTGNVKANSGNINNGRGPGNGKHRRNNDKTKDGETSVQRDRPRSARGRGGGRGGRGGRSGRGPKPQES